VISPGDLRRLNVIAPVSLDASLDLGTYPGRFSLGLDSDAERSGDSLDELVQEIGKMTVDRAGDHDLHVPSVKGRPDC